MARLTEAGKGAKRPKRRGHMFLVDVPTFAKVCSLGDADASAAYLILAAGTGPDNRTSTWSREAINKRTALNWRKADGAMAKLEQNGLIRWLSGKGTRKPRIDLPPVETRQPMQKHVAALASRIAQGEQPRTAPEKAAATLGRQQGWLACDDAGVWSCVPSRPAKMAFLPMELVGDAFGATDNTATTIVDRIRKSRDPMALQLLVDLYALQDLAEQGGVDRQHYYTKFDRETGPATGSLQLWKFERGGEWVAWNGPLDHHRREPTASEKKQGRNAGSDFFDRARVLADAGALEWVYYLAEDDSPTSPLIYPAAVQRHGKMVWTELESIVGGYATRAACALSHDAADKLDYAKRWENCAPSNFLLPADRLARQAALIGIPRLRHRARTSNASRWRQELVEGAKSNIAMLRGIIAENAPALLDEADRRFADFNDASKKASTLHQCDINDTSQSGKHSSPSLRDGGGENEFSPPAHDPDSPDAGPATGGVMDRRMAAWMADAEEHFRAAGERF
ncbi:MAG: hypothetical protein BGP16_18285 [Sphingobium sp. 66-54]|nr:MAG: hypothetical protein BGP16_18285 [Sphingobium sp. 66-54]